MGTAQLIFTFREDMSSHNTRHKNSKNIGDILVFKRQVCGYFPYLAPKSRE